jgi:hypothetical protein
MNSQHPAAIEFRLKRADSITSVNSYFTNDSAKTSRTSFPVSSLLSSVGVVNKKAPLNFEQLHLRLCLNCGLALEKKYKSVKDKIIKPKIINLYDVCKLIHELITL